MAGYVPLAVDCYGWLRIAIDVYVGWFGNAMKASVWLWIGLGGYVWPHLTMD